MPAIPNVSDSLSRAIYAELLTVLPPSPDDTPEAIELRNQRAMTDLSHLVPENAAEAEVCVQIVAAQFQARHALRAASRPSLDPAEIRRCRVQAASMMRQADSGIRTLLRLQAERVKAETAMHPAAMERAGYWFKSVSVPESERQPAAEPLEPMPTFQTTTVPRLEYGAMTPAERYATLYPDRATRILTEHGLPARLTFPPPNPEVVTDLLSSSSPIVRALYQSAPAW